MFFKKSSRETPEKKAGLFERMKKALGATKESLVGRIEAVLGSVPAIDEGALEELEGTLLGADLGVRVTDRVMGAVRAAHKKGEIPSPDAARGVIRNQLLEILEVPELGGVEGSGTRPEVWMVVGVNGTGKTTTVGKLASRLTGEGRRILICAADTFRPAAIEQLAVWAERSGSELIRSRIGGIPRRCSTTPSPRPRHARPTWCWSTRPVGCTPRAT